MADSATVAPNGVAVELFRMSGDAHEVVVGIKPLFREQVRTEAARLKATRPQLLGITAEAKQARKTKMELVRADSLSKQSKIRADLAGLMNILVYEAALKHLCTEAGDQPILSSVSSRLQRSSSPVSSSPTSLGEIEAERRQAATAQAAQHAADAVEAKVAVDSARAQLLNDTIAEVDSSSSAERAPRSHLRSSSSFAHPPSTELLAALSVLNNLPPPV
jgi:hypothetical protein